MLLFVKLHYSHRDHPITPTTDQPDRDNTELKKEREPSVSSHL